MLGTVVNTAAVIIGALIGLVLKKGLPVRIQDALMKGIGLLIIYIGISGALEGNNTLVVIVSIVAGAIIGEWIDIDRRLNSLGAYVESKFVKNGEGMAAKAFVTSSLLFCVGAMAIVGSLDSGLSGRHGTIYAKSILDFIASIVFASSLGYGVLFSAAAVFIYQGAIVLSAVWAAPFLSQAVVAEMTCAGSILIIGLGLNILGVTKIKIANYLPALFLPILLMRFM